MPAFCMKKKLRALERVSAVTPVVRHYDPAETFCPVLTLSCRHWVRGCCEPDGHSYFCR